MRVDDKGRRRTRRWGIPAVCVAVIVGAVWISLGVYRTIASAPEIIADAHAAWVVGDLIIDHLESHENEWPSGWNDLHAAAAERLKRPGSLRWAADDLEPRVRVRFNVDVEAIKAAESTDVAPFPLVTKPDGSAFAAYYEEPNEMIWRFLRTGERPP